jgi:CelD/BcsL family acetyltransferase involved in cellulose biosynthesis/RimJ/RimL family protein N-acetyltransferase
MKFQLEAGRAARQWFELPANQLVWRQLQDACPWATPYQSPEFASIWFSHYGDVWEPLLVVARDDDGTLIGLMPLARKDLQIVGVGAHQAEYQGWLSAPDDVADFLTGALSVLFKAWPDTHLRLRYVDVLNNAEKFLDWAKGQNNVILDSHERPLMTLDASEIDAILRKRSNRSKLNRLKREGELVFTQDHLETNTASNLDEIIALYDFRQGAANDSCPFVDDPRKRAFHLDWLTRAPNHFSVFRILLQGHTVAALIGILGPNRVSNAIVAYSPHHARHSPGKLLVYLAAKSLLTGNTHTLDLTPGGDPWKQRFATYNDQVHELNAWSTATAVHRRQRLNRVETAIRTLLALTGLPPHRLRSWLTILGRIRPRSVWNAISKALPRRTEFRVYRMHLDNLPQVPAAGMAGAGHAPRIDALDDLVYFSPVAAWQTRHRFLSDALERIEQGERVYSARADKTLLHYGWRIREQREAYFTEVKATYVYPEPGAVLYDFFTHPSARRQGWYQRTVSCMLQDLDRESTSDGGPRVVYISVLANNRASRHVIEKLGFEYLESLIRVGGFGWSRCYKASLVGES